MIYFKNRIYIIINLYNNIILIKYFFKKIFKKSYNKI